MIRIKHDYLVNVALRRLDEQFIWHGGLIVILVDSD